MKKLFILFICTVSSFLGAQEKITVLANDFPPLVFAENGSLKGFDIDLWDEIAKRAEIDFEYKPDESIKWRKISILQYQKMSSRILSNSFS